MAEFDRVGRIPEPGDNVAIASHRLDAGLRVNCDGRSYTLSHAVLEGHRFAHEPIESGASLLSWGLPFGTATRDIEPGEYVCNDKILNVLAGRHVGFDLPDSANFVDYYQAYEFDPGAIECGSQVDRHAESRYFDGFDRDKQRGVGTRNHIVILGTTSLTGSYVRALADRFKHLDSARSNMDGVVAVAHTEGGQDEPNNLELILRTLHGFMLHPNVGAVLAVDCDGAAVSNALLRDYAVRHKSSFDDVLHRFMTLGARTSIDAALQEGEAIVRAWLDPVDQFTRTRQSVAHLKLALQCGGSDAFSGISGNPLVGWVARELIRYGGTANIAETTELIGAERYMLQRVRDPDTARSFLRTIAAYDERAGWHGHDAEGNTSGGNNFRGLYNIAVKSIGAARKKAPDVRLDEVIDYAEPMREPGFYFMDSPGNDLESIAGQVASGANLITFTTGNGSITNFPFVPTIKVITTTDRYNLIRHDMDINAGRYQDGTPMDELGAESFDLALRVASGERTLGEKAGHSQVQIWRDWSQTDATQLNAIRKAAEPTGEPLTIHAMCPSGRTFSAYRTADGFTADQVGVIVPTSLCAAQVARMIAQQLNDRPERPRGISRYVAFVHTEGCGVSSGDNEELYLRTIIGHALHPIVRCGVFLEHGCEKTHNDAMRAMLTDADVDANRFGWASIQMDGGIDRASEQVVDWLDSRLTGGALLQAEDVGLAHFRLGLTSVGPVADNVAAALAEITATVVTSGGTVVTPHNASLTASDAFTRPLLDGEQLHPTLAYGQRAVRAGIHVMDTPTGHTAETLTGLGATGVDVMLVHTADRPVQVHPMVPVIQVTSADARPDMDRMIDPITDARTICGDLLDLIVEVASRRYTPILTAQGYTDFQITRGLLGISL